MRKIILALSLLITMTSLRKKEMPLPRMQEKPLFRPLRKHGEGKASQGQYS